METQTPGIRQGAGMIFAISVLIMLASSYVGLVYHGTLDAGAEFVVNLDFGVWIAGFFIALAGLTVLLLFLFALAPRPSEVGIIPAGASASQVHEAVHDLNVGCNSCDQQYVITDTGERPLYHACPHCGHSDVLAGDGAVRTADSESPQDAQIPHAFGDDLVPGTVRTIGEGERELIVRCTGCDNAFATPYTEERPLYALCPYCGKKGVLYDSPGSAPGLDALDVDTPDDRPDEQVHSLGAERHEDEDEDVDDGEPDEGPTEVPRL